MLRSTRTHLALVAAAIAIVLTAGRDASALPRMALTAGSPCATCHTQPQGGGIRNSIGFGTSQHTGMVHWSNLGLPSLDKGSPTFASEAVTIGADIRSVVARLGRPTGDKDKAELPSFLYVPMQLMPYVGLKLGDHVDVVGSYNLATTQRSYPGQPSWEAAIQWHGDASLPTLRAGMIQPTIGIRHDDHTMLIRANAAAPRQPFLPPNYADPGIEATWQPRAWFRAEAGGYMTMNLSESIRGAVKDDDIAYSARFTFLPQFFFGTKAGPPGSSSGPAGDDDGFGDDDDDDFGEDDDEPAKSASSMSGSINTWIGLSAFGAGEFAMQNAFVGVGVSELASLMLEAATVQRGGDFTAINIMALLSVRLGFEWLYLNARYEQATATDTADSKDYETSQYVVGLEWFPLPYLEIRPELRMIQTNEYMMRHYTFQFHTAF